MSILRINWAFQTKILLRVFEFFLVICNLTILILFKSKVYFHFNFSPYFLVCAESWDTFWLNYVHYGSHDHLFITQILPAMLSMKLNPLSLHTIFFFLWSKYIENLTLFRFVWFRFVWFRFVSTGVVKCKSQMIATSGKVS